MEIRFVHVSIHEDKLRSRPGGTLDQNPGRVTVIGMFDDDEAADSLDEMQVEIEWEGRKLGVPLAQLGGVGDSKATAEAIADWHYWVAQGRQF